VIYNIEGGGGDLAGRHTRRTSLLSLILELTGRSLSCLAIAEFLAENGQIGPVPQQILPQKPVGVFVLIRVATVTAGAQKYRHPWPA
jgi:hypothetical protein